MPLHEIPISLELKGQRRRPFRARVLLSAACIATENTAPVKNDRAQLTLRHFDKGGMVPIHVQAILQRAAGAIFIRAEEDINGALRAAQVHL